MAEYNAVGFYAFLEHFIDSFVSFLSSYGILGYPLLDLLISFTVISWLLARLRLRSNGSWPGRYKAFRGQRYEDYDYRRSH